MLFACWSLFVVLTDAGVLVVAFGRGGGGIEGVSILPVPIPFGCLGTGNDDGNARLPMGGALDELLDDEDIGLEKKEQRRLTKAIAKFSSSPMSRISSMDDSNKPGE